MTTICPEMLCFEHLGRFFGLFLFLLFFLFLWFLVLLGFVLLLFCCSLASLAQTSLRPTVLLPVRLIIGLRSTSTANFTRTNFYNSSFRRPSSVGYKLLEQLPMPPSLSSVVYSKGGAKLPIGPTKTMLSGMLRNETGPVHAVRHARLGITPKFSNVNGAAIFSGPPRNGLKIVGDRFDLQVTAREAAPR